MNCRSCLTTLTTLLLLTFAASGVHAEVFRCVDVNGKVSYQQRPCEGVGTKVDVHPANEQLPTAGKPTQPSPSKAADAAPIPVPETTQDRWSAYREPGLRLSLGMSVRQVVEAWGLPTDIREDRNYTFMHWCDMRMVLLVDGQARAWDAPFRDSKKGAQLYSYGEPWTHASQRWGADRKTVAYQGPLLGRGETQKWTDLRWVVTDSHGSIVGWCDAAEHRSPVRPPAFNPPWDNALSR